MMHGKRNLMDELGEPAGMSRSAIALCCAIMEDAEVAREFEMEPRGAAELLRAAFTPAYASGDSSPLPRRRLLRQRQAPPKTTRPGSPKATRTPRP